jgi:uncharacterized membrane protein
MTPGISGTIATVVDFTTNYVVVGDVATAAGLSAFGFFLGRFVYFGHEKAWDHFWLALRARAGGTGAEAPAGACVTPNRALRAYPPCCGRNAAMASVTVSPSPFDMPSGLWCAMRRDSKNSAETARTPRLRIFTRPNPSRALAVSIAALLLPASGVVAAQSRAGPVVGFVDNIQYVGDRYYVFGWACQRGNRASIDVARETTHEWRQEQHARHASGWQTIQNINLTLDRRACVIERICTLLPGVGNETPRAPGRIADRREDPNDKTKSPPFGFGFRRYQQRLQSRLWRNKIIIPLPVQGEASSLATIGVMTTIGQRLAVSEARLALPNFYNITIRIANIAARLAVLVLWLCDKLGPSISP